MNDDSTAKLGFFARIGRGFSILLILGVFAAIALAVVLYLRGERFDLRRTAIEGNAVVSDEELKKLLPLGDNLFDILLCSLYRDFSNVGINTSQMKMSFLYELKGEIIIGFYPNLRSWGVIECIF